MTGAARAEIYFIAAMMVLILIVSGASVYFFFKQYKKEMKERADRKAKAVEKTQAVKSDQPG